MISELADNNSFHKYEVQKHTQLTTMSSSAPSVCKQLNISTEAVL